MATPTSSSNRSKRKGTKPITQGQNPQRSNRQKVSNAKVTNSSNRGGNSGSAKVTTGRGASAPKPADPWKAPTPKNSRTSAPKGNTTFRTQNTGITLPNSRRAGVNLPKTGARAERTAARVADLRKASAPKPSASAGASSAARGAASAGARGLARGAGKLLGRAAVPLEIAAKAKEVFNPKDNIITRGAALGRSIERVVGSGGGGNMTPGQRNAQLAAKRGQRQGPQQTSEMVADYKAKRDARHQSLRDKMPPVKARTSSSSGGGNSSPSRSGGGGNNTAPRSQTPPKPRFTGTVDEGRQKWAEKYSSSKYDGQAIQKEAKKLLEKMKERKQDKSNAQRAGWDGNKNY